MAFIQTRLLMGDLRRKNAEVDTKSKKHFPFECLKTRVHLLVGKRAQTSGA